MQTSTRGQGPGARIVAALASAFVLVTGAAMMMYALEFKGSGVQSELGGVAGPEVLMLGGGLVLLTAVAFVVVSMLAGRSSRGPHLGDLLQRAHALDVTDPEALKEFDSVPELRDMVAELVTEKAHARELSDRFDRLRRELDGVVDGMRRSSEDGGHLREEGACQAVVQLAAMWNQLIDRVHEARASGRGDGAADGTRHDVAVPEIAALVERLDELESELERLRAAVATPAAEPPRGELWRASEATPASVSPAPAAPRGWGEVDVGESDKVAGWNPPEFESEPAPAAADAPTLPARELFLDDDTFAPVDGYVEVAAEPDTTPAESRRVADPFAPQSLLPGGLGAAPAPAAPPPAEVAPGMRFPEFVGRTPKKVEGRVELTYENQTPEEVVDLPASALLFDSGPEPEPDARSSDAVFDLRSFGATEFDQ